MWLSVTYKCQMSPGIGQAAKLAVLAHIWNVSILENTWPIPNWEQLQDFMAGQDWLCVTHST